MSRAAMLEDLARSGLTKQDATLMRCRVLTPAKTRELVRIRAAAYQIPYFDVDGKKNGFWRVRFLQDVPDRKRPDKLVRYSQPANAPPQLYLAPTVDWSEIRSHPDVPVWFTEGEKKAASACKSGLPCVGLGGVWNWRSKRSQLKIIPAFSRFEWEGREVVLCFDSDFSDNPNVKAAMHALARELFNLGAEVSFKMLPQDPTGSKVGLDDYLLDHSLRDLLSLPEEPFMESVEILGLNRELAVIYEPGGVLHIPSGTLYSSPVPLSRMIYANRTMPKVLESGKVKEVGVMDEWLKSKFRREHREITYRPGCHAETTDDDCYNLWTGWGTEPEEGDASLFVRLVDHLCSDVETEVRDWFVRWLAYPLQNPGAKMYTAVLLLSRKQGTGKTLLGYTMGRIYGDNFQEVGKDDLHRSFNQWADRKQFILGDEITGSDKRQEADKLKSLVTRQDITVNAKYQKEYVIPDCINYLLASNHADALFLENHDRRFCVIETQADPLPREWYDRYDAWYRDLGCARVFRYLLDVDLGDFDPLGPAPVTAAKRDMIDINKMDVDHWASLVIEDPDEALMGSTTELWTTTEMRELVRRFLDERGYMVSIRQITSALAKEGVLGRPVRLADGRVKKLYPLRRGEYWEKRWDEPSVWAARYEEERAAISRTAAQRY